MDPQDPGRVRLDGLRCAVCDGSVPADAVRLLAWRDDVAFVQLTCDACSSSTLAFLVDGRPDSDERRSRTPAGTAPEVPVSSDDVLEMHLFLREWQGGLRELVHRSRSAP